MKKKYLFSVVMAALLMGACQSEDVVPPAGGAGGPEWTADRKGYVSVAINLPTQPAALRAANDNFDDGTPEEYYVKDATLILFTAGEGEPEAQAKFHSAYKLNAADWNKSGTSEDNITTTTKIVQKINEVEGNVKLYALVVLNDNGVLTANEDNTLTVGEGLSPVTSTTTLTDLNTMVSQAVSADAWNSASFLMTNAPLCTVAGGSQAATDGALKVLSEVDTEKIKDTEEAARNEVAAKIYVERAQAKVTLTGKTGNFESGSKLSYEVEGWILDNINTKSFLVRDYDLAWNNLSSNQSGVDNPFRFVGSTAVATGLYRTYWGKDVNYDKNATTDLKKVADDDGHVQVGVEMLEPDGETSAYCFENTADVAHMTEENNTRVVVKAKLNGGTDFYVVNDNKDVVYLEGDGDNSIGARVKEAFLAYPGIEAWFKTNLASGQALNPAADLTVTLAGADNGGVVKDIQVNLTEAGKGKLKQGVSDLGTEQKGCLNGSFKVDYYKDGISYYTVYIAHFGDDLTPWNEEETPKPSVTGTDATGIYPIENQERNYLGRWGVLRNNWYDLNVTGIRTIGSSTVPPVEPEEPIDKLDKYISVEINILAWAKRAQDVVL